MTIVILHLPVTMPGPNEEAAEVGGIDHGILADILEGLIPLMARAIPAALADMPVAPARPAAPIVVQHGTGRKMENFTTGDAVDWMHWKARFRIVADINEWTAARARRELLASISGHAQTYVSQIPHGANPPNGNARPYEELLTLLDSQFLPVAAGRLARSDFQASKQQEDENTNTFHVRVRGYYVRANPHMTQPEIDVSRDLIEKFAEGLTSPQAVYDLLKNVPATYPAALDQATGAASSALRLHEIMGKGNIKTEQGINYITNSNLPLSIRRGKSSTFPSGPTFRKTLADAKEREFFKNAICHYCDKRGHIKPFCRAWIATKQKDTRDAPMNRTPTPRDNYAYERNPNNRGRFTNNWRGRGDRGGRRQPYQTNRNNTPRPRINALNDSEDQDETTGPGSQQGN